MDLILPSPPRRELLAAFGSKKAKKAATKAASSGAAVDGHQQRGVAVTLFAPEDDDKAPAHHRQFAPVTMGRGGAFCLTEVDPNLCASSRTPPRGLTTPPPSCLGTTADAQMTDDGALVLLASAPRAFSTVGAFSPEPIFKDDQALLPPPCTSPGGLSPIPLPGASPIPGQSRRGGTRRSGHAGAVAAAAAVIRSNPSPSVSPARGYRASCDPAMAELNHSPSPCPDLRSTDALAKHKYNQGLVRGALFDAGAVTPAVTPGRSASRSPSQPGDVVMFDGALAVVGDASKLRHAPRPPQPHALSAHSPLSRRY